jgi:hypothetical protein
MKPISSIWDYYSLNEISYLLGKQSDSTIVSKVPIKLLSNGK